MIDAWLSTVRPNAEKYAKLQALAAGKFEICRADIPRYAAMGLNDMAIAMSEPA